MPNVIRSREETIGLMLDYLGTGDPPNAWWPTGKPSYDDCAACVSWALFGLNGDQPYQTLVSGVIERSGLTFYPGSYGIERGDAVGFLWGGNNNYDHIEIALESPDAQGNFRTIGTNAGPNDDMAIRWRTTGYVVAFGRPAYLSPAGGGGKPIGDDMAEYDREVIRREARARLYFNTDTGQRVAADIQDSYWRPNDGEDNQPSRWASPYLIIGTGDDTKPQLLNGTEWGNLIHEINLGREVRGWKPVSDWTPTARELARVGK